MSPRFGSKKPALIRLKSERPKRERLLDEGAPPLLELPVTTADVALLPPLEDFPDSEYAPSNRNSLPLWLTIEVLVALLFLLFGGATIRFYAPTSRNIAHDEVAVSAPLKAPPSPIEIPTIAAKAQREDGKQADEGGGLLAVDEPPLVISSPIPNGPPPATASSRAVDSPPKVLEGGIATSAVGTATSQGQHEKVGGGADQVGGNAPSDDRLDLSPPYKIISAGRIATAKATIRFAYIDALEAGDVCFDGEGGRIACGLRARAALFNRIGSKSLTCLAVPYPGERRYDCTSGSEKISNFLVASGFARPDALAGETLSQTMKDAQTRLEGAWSGGWKLVARSKSRQTPAAATATSPTEAHEKVAPGQMQAN